jgi:Putative peptidoglycan binding domain
LRRRRALAAGLPVVALGAVAAAVVAAGGEAPADRPAGGVGAAGGTEVVQRRTLVESVQVDGTLGYGDLRPALDRVGGTLTWLPRAGAVIEPGQTLFAVDDRPVVLMDGTVPAWRTLETGVRDGADVRQLERNLAALGYDPGVVDGTFTAATAGAVRAWQDDLDLPQTGRVELGRVVFLPGARRVAEVKGSLGGGGATGAAWDGGDGLRTMPIADVGTTPATGGATGPGDGGGGGTGVPGAGETTPRGPAPQKPPPGGRGGSGGRGDGRGSGGAGGRGGGGSGGSGGRGDGDGSGDTGGNGGGGGRGGAGGRGDGNGSGGAGGGAGAPGRGGGTPGAGGDGTGPGAAAPGGAAPDGSAPAGGGGAAGDGGAGGDGSGGGAGAGTEVLATTSTDRVVTAKLDTADQALARVGRRAEVTLPDGSVVAGRIMEVGTVATGGGDDGGGGAGGGEDTATLPVTIRLRSARRAGRLDEAPVTVALARTTRRDVLAVPVEALIARPGGGYAVAVVRRGSAQAVDVPVQPGMFADGWVELTDGAVREGDRVKVPR